MGIKRELTSLAKSFSYAIKGIAYSIKNERNMRIHLCMVVLVTMFSYFYRLTISQYIPLLICMGLVISGEMVNTAIETLTNLESPSYNQLARIAKDVAAGAVFVSAIISIIVGVFTFGDIDRLIVTFIDIAATPLYWVAFLVAIVLSVMFILNGARLIKDQKTKIYHLKNYPDKRK